MGICKYCGTEKGNIAMHEKYCTQNPDRINTKKSQSQCDPAEDFSQTKIKPPISSILATSADDTHKTPEPEPLIIIDVQPANIDPEVDDVAWFEDANGKKINKIPLLVGSLTNKDRTEIIPCVLVMSANGTLLPPFMLAGFIGMFWRYQEFPEDDNLPAEPIEHDTAFPEERYEEGFNKPNISPQAEENTVQVITPQEKPKRKSLLAGIFGKKEKEPEKKKEPEKESETAALAKQIVDASGGTS